MVSQFDSGVMPWRIPVGGFTTHFFRRIVQASPREPGKQMASNIVKHRDFMLADDLPTWREAEELRLQKYGHEYVVVIRADIDPDKESSIESGIR